MGITTERRSGIQATAQRMRFLLEADRNVEQAILRLEAEGRMLQKTHGLRSSHVREKAREIDQQFGVRNRIGTLIVRMQARSSQ
jgi:hypothetical protein